MYRKLVLLSITAGGILFAILHSYSLILPYYGPSQIRLERWFYYLGPPAIGDGAAHLFGYRLDDTVGSTSWEYWIISSTAQWASWAAYLFLILAFCLPLRIRERLLMLTMESVYRRLLLLSIALAGVFVRVLPTLTGTRGLPHWYIVFLSWSPLGMGIRIAKFLGFDYDPTPWQFRVIEHAVEWLGWTLFFFMMALAVGRFRKSSHHTLEKPT